MKATMLTGALALGLAVSSASAQAIDPNNPLYAPPGPDEVFIQLADRTGEPRGFCVDFPGFPVSGVVSAYRESAWPMGVHTCKTNIEHANVASIDQLFSKSATASESLRFTRLNVCLEVLTFRGVSAPGHVAEVSIRQDAPLVANACSGKLEQQFTLTADGRIKPLADPTKCLTVGQEVFEAGDRAPGQPWRRRDLNFSACADALAGRQTWTLAPVA